jgi:cyclopropane fatty-acyl-phospholipid synthase-like methyltransferase
MADIGGGTGQLSCYVAKNHPHMKCVSTDLAIVQPVAKRWIAKLGCEKQVMPILSDYLTDAFPKADVITMGMILHDIGIEQKKLLIRKAYDALPPGGALVSIETIIDDDRRTNATGLCMSLHMIIEFGAEGGFDFTGVDFNRWCLLFLS